MQNLRRFRSLAVLVVGLSLALVVWTQRYNLYDWWRLQGYEPSDRIEALADETAMTEYGRRLFYVNHPQLDDAEAFNENCVISEASIVLGCYVSGHGIFLFDVEDERLHGVHHVTAAHEMLHAAYDRLSSSERRRIDKLTSEAFDAVTDERIIETIAAYNRRDPGIVPNELHSILATEVEALPTELEEYYKRYFSDRQVIVKLSKAYEAAFEERRGQVVAYDAQLSSMKQQIEQNTARLDSEARAIAEDRQELSALLAQQRYGEYNSRVSSFNSRVNSYNSLVGQTGRLIDRYNDLVQRRNAIALEENELIEAIDSRPDTLSGQ